MPIKNVCTDLVPNMNGKTQGVHCTLYKEHNQLTTSTIGPYNYRQQQLSINQTCQNCVQFLLKLKNNKV